MRGVQGTTKRLKISRSVMDGSGKSQRVQVAACTLAVACYIAKGRRECNTLDMA